MTRQPIKTSLWIGILLAFTFLIFANSLRNDFTNWDDHAYITENPHIREFSLARLKFLVVTTWRTAELTLPILSFTVDYALWKLNPLPYHAENLILHLLNTLLVFLLVCKLTRCNRTAFLTAFFWAIHPFRVESVAWVSQRKDVLYACFYLLGMLRYVDDLNTHGHLQSFFTTSILFICTLLSKDAALTFLPILFLLDYYIGRRWTARVLLEKFPLGVILLIRLWNHYLMPHPLPPLIMGNVAAQTASFHLFDRVFLGCYALLFYIIGLFAPFHLAVIHPFPLTTGHFLPWRYYLSGVLVALLSFAIWRLRSTIRCNKLLIFGGVFFLINIGITLHIVPFGGVSVVAERYTYLAHIGLFLVISTILTPLLDTQYQISRRKKNFLLTGLALYLSLFVISTIQRNMVWKNSLTLWNDQIQKYPEYALAYTHRGDARRKMGDLTAVDDFTRAIALDPQNAAAYNNRGLMEAAMKNYDAALQDFHQAITLQPNLAAAYNNRGMIRNVLADYPGAIADLNAALTLQPDLAEAYYNRGNAYAMLAEYVRAIADFTHAINLSPGFTDAYNHRGKAQGLVGAYSGAIEDFTHAIALNPQQAEPYYHRGVVKALSGHDKGALADFTQALAVHRQFADAYEQRGNLYQKQGEWQRACSDWTTAKNLGNARVIAVLQQYCQGNGR